MTRAVVFTLSRRKMVTNHLGRSGPLDSSADTRVKHGVTSHDTVRSGSWEKYWICEHGWEMKPGSDNIARCNKCGELKVYL
eukprot:g51585.t1